MKNISRISVIISLSIFLFAFLFFGFAAYANTGLSADEKKRIYGIVDEEFSFVKEGLIYIEKNRDAVWAHADLELYGFWLNGLEKEIKGEFASAIEFYKKALEVERYEMSSYEVLFPLGRVYVLNDDRDKALAALEEFLKKAESEFSDSSPWYLDPAGEKILIKNMGYARWLINLLGKDLHQNIP